VRLIGELDDTGCANGACANGDCANDGCANGGSAKGGSGLGSAGAGTVTFANGFDAVKASLPREGTSMGILPQGPSRDLPHSKIAKAHSQKNPSPETQAL
jgi:hypothetical protein